VKKKELIMFTLSEINTATGSRDGDIFSDLHKDVYGFRPRGVTFDSPEAFDAEFERLVVRLGEQQDEDEIRQNANMERFAQRVLETMELCNCDQRRAVEIIADAEGELEDYKFYGPERLEYSFDLKYGSIKQAIFGDFN
jgi:hypothetical protein